MTYKPYRELEEMIRRNYLAVDRQHATHDDDNRFEIGAGDWANPIDTGEHCNMPAQQLAPLPTDAYVFAYPFDDEIGYFEVKLGPQIISVTRVSFEDAKLKAL
jgi:hypothetical protein